MKLLTMCIVAGIALNVHAQEPKARPQPTVKTILCRMLAGSIATFATHSVIYILENKTKVVKHMHSCLRRI